MLYKTEMFVGIFIDCSCVLSRHYDATEIDTRLHENWIDSDCPEVTLKQ